MKYYDFKYWIIGVSSEADVMDAVNAYLCLIDDGDHENPIYIDEFEGYKMARNEGYTVEELEGIEADVTGVKVALINKELSDSDMSLAIRILRGIKEDK